LEEDKLTTIYKIVVTDEIGTSYENEKNVFRDLDVEFIVSESTTQEELIEDCKDADGILCNLSPMPKEIIQELDKCKVISRYGIGVDNVDIEACTEKGIWVANVKDYCLHEVSEHAIALLLACARNIVGKHTHIKRGVWDKRRDDQAFRFYGKNMAFVGFGSIARTMIKKLKAFGLNIMVYDPFVSEEDIEREGAVKVEWEFALKNADFISIHLPYNENTKNIFDSAAFSLMKPTAVIVNTSRGGVIDENALITALEERRIFFAGLDVFAKEPIDVDNPLMMLDNCVLTDHSAWYSLESFKELKTKCAENVRDVLVGNKPIYPINEV